MCRGSLGLIPALLTRSLPTVWTFRPQQPPSEGPQGHGLGQRPPCVQVPLEFHLQSGFISRVKQPKKSRLGTRQTCSPVCFWTYIIIPFDQLLSLLSSPQDSHYRIKTSCHMTAQECTKGSYIAPSRFSDVQVRFEEPRRLFSKGPFTAVIHAGPFKSHCIS